MIDLRQLGYEALQEMGSRTGTGIPTLDVGVTGPGRSLLEMMPEPIASDPDIVGMTKALDFEIGEVANQVWLASPLLHLDRLPEYLIDEVARGMGIGTMKIWADASIDAKRLFMKAPSSSVFYGILGMRRRSGTVGAVKRMAFLLNRSFLVVENPSGLGAFHYNIDFTSAIAGADEADVVEKVREYCLRFGRATCKLAKIRDISGVPRDLWVA